MVSPQKDVKLQIVIRGFAPGGLQDASLTATVTAAEHERLEPGGGHPLQNRLPDPPAQGFEPLLELIAAVQGKALLCGMD